MNEALHRVHEAIGMSPELCDVIRADLGEQSRDGLSEAMKALLEKQDRLKDEA